MLHDCVQQNPSLSTTAKSKKFLTALFDMKNIFMKIVFQIAEGIQ